ncbi:MAG: daptide biosynthesis intramembrane metalloprotease [Egibacteraceae bacterium]
MRRGTAASEAASAQAIPGGVSVSLSERPKIAVVEVGGPASGRDGVVVCCPNRNRYVRIQGPQWAFLRSLDGRRTIAELEQDFEGLPRGMVRPLLLRFAELGLLENAAEDTSRPRNRRLRVAQTGVIQLTLLDPEKLLNRLTRLIRLLGSPAGRVASALVAAVGLCSMVIHARLAWIAPQQLRDPAWAAALAAAVFLACVLHELGHAFAVKYYGGRVRRMGLMLLYLMPAMFCDTSDAWRFPRNRQRAVVAAAGIWVQMVLAGLALIALWLPLNPEMAAWLWLFALINIGLCMMNLFPFVKLDGYWILVALTDMPNLRSCALDCLRRKTLRLVTGIAQPQPQPQPPPPAHPVLTMMFGLGCLLLPPLLIAAVLIDYQHALLRYGRVGAAAWLILAGNVLAIPRKGLFRMVRSARGWPRSARLRAGLVGGTTALIVTGALALIQIPLTAQARYEVSDAGGITAMLPEEAGQRLGPGDRTATVPVWFWTTYLHPALSTFWR